MVTTSAEIRANFHHPLIATAGLCRARHELRFADGAQVRRVVGFELGVAFMKTVFSIPDPVSTQARLGLALGLWLLAPVCSWATQIEGNAVLIGQHPGDSSVHDDLTLSADLYISGAFETGSWLAHLEGATTPRGGGVAEQLADANGDAASAIDADGDGRVQLSELLYARRFGAASLTVGLLDPTRFLDTSDTANDETRQFIGGMLANNSTIAFPDYTLGAAYQIDIADGFTGTFLLTGASGLGDNGARSYRELFEQNTVFGAIEFALIHDRRSLALGIWRNNADFVELQRPSARRAAFGAYAIANLTRADYLISARVGWSDPRTNTYEGFASVALERPIRPHLLAGIGWARGFASPGLPSPAGNSSQAEVFVRFQPQQWPWLSITASVQHLDNAGAVDGADAWVSSIRLTALRD